MIKKTVTYKDYNGNDRTEDFYFNLTETELLDMEMSTDGGLSGMINTMSQTKDVRAIYKVFKDLVLKSYGKKTADGMFVKTEEIALNFTYTPAFSKIFMDMATNAAMAADFINELIPKELIERLGDQAPAELKAQLANKTT